MLLHSDLIKTVEFIDSIVFSLGLDSYSLADALRAIDQNSYLSKIDLPRSSKASLVEALSLVRLKLMNLRILKLTLPAEAGSSLLQNIYSFFDSVFGPGEESCLKLSYDASIIGGVIIEYNGHYLDKSVKKTLENLFKNDKEFLNEFLG